LHWFIQGNLSPLLGYVSLFVLLVSSLFCKLVLRFLIYTILTFDQKRKSVHPDDSCQFLASDVVHPDDSLKFCLIGFVAGKCPGYTMLSQFIAQHWIHHAKPHHA
jgi:hypothetical protein